MPIECLHGRPLSREDLDRILLVFLTNPPSGAPTLGANATYSLSAIDPVSLTLLMISLGAGLMVPGMTLWLLGPIGLFLSVPLTMVLAVALNTSPHTRPIAILLGSEVTPSETSDRKLVREQADVGGDEPGTPG